uniref:Putative LOV domain-containing protein n=1 Tax=Cymbomonas sp. BC-2016 TaxID=1799572 RepID=A0A126X3N0_9CHLO|nr:putative LOV domain-containing protein [Cymbomonas sp. BC-2016]
MRRTKTTSHYASAGSMSGHNLTSGRSKKLAHTCLPDFDLSEQMGRMVEGNISFCLSDRTVRGCPIVQVSPEFCKMTGYSEQEVLGQNCRFLQGKDTDERTINTLRQAIANLQECMVVILNYRKDGTRFMNLVRLMPLHTGNQSYYLGIQLEIPENTVYDSQIRSSYCPNFPPPARENAPGDNALPDIVGFELLSKSLNQLCGTYVITDAKAADQPIVYASPGFCTLTGYSASEVLGKNCRFLQGFNTNKQTVKKIASAIENKTGLTTNILNYKKDGTAFWNLLVISCIRNQLGEVEYIVGAQLDVSNQAHDAPPMKEEMSPIAKTMDVARIHNLVSQIKIA